MAKEEHKISGKCTFFIVMCLIVLGVFTVPFYIYYSDKSGVESYDLKTITIIDKWDGDKFADANGAIYKIAKPRTSRQILNASFFDYWANMGYCIETTYFDTVRYRYNNLKIGGVYKINCREVGFVDFDFYSVEETEKILEDNGFKVVEKGVLYLPNTIHMTIVKEFWLMAEKVDQ